MRNSLQVFKGMGAADAERVQSAWLFAEKHLSDFKRRGGETYAEHGFEVALALHESTSDAPMLCIAILHDLLVHPDGERLLSESPLTKSERALARSMHNLRRLHIDSKTKDLDKVLESFLSDSRLIPLRMAHRLNDVRHLDRFDPELRQTIAHETLHMYTALAGRMGMHVWRYEMEDICFKLLQPQTARRLEQKLEQTSLLDETSLRHTLLFLKKHIRRQGILCDFNFRIKSLYSTYRKMLIKNRRFDELTDRLALRILTDDVLDCYRVLGIVHRLTHPIPGKLKDYIGMPKENAYQSIHTVIYPLPGVTQQPIEIQIRTHQMHRRCEFGPAAHGDYKHQQYSLNKAPARVNLFRNLASLREHARSPRQFEQALRKYFDEDQLAVFDHRNNLYHLKKPASAMDFVCMAYPKRCKRLKEVYLNGRFQPPETPLFDGDIVEARFGRAIIKTTCRSHNKKQLPAK